MRVFVSYRRADEAIAVGDVVGRLRTRFGVDRVFYDVESLDVGDEFWSRIAAWIADSDAVLVMVGRYWQPERLSDPADYVRREIELAFELDKTVVPVVIDRGRVPRAERLPVTLGRLPAVNHGQRLRIPPDFDRDVASLISQPDRIERDRAPRGRPAGERHVLRSAALAAAA
jgi:hypothetical protein